MKQDDGSVVVQFFRLFNMLTLARWYETRLFRHSTNHIFRSLYFGKVSFFSKSSTFDVDFRNGAKNSENIFCYLDNCS